MRKTLAVWATLSLMGCKEQVVPPESIAQPVVTASIPDTRSPLATGEQADQVGTVSYGEQVELRIAGRLLLRFEPKAECPKPDDWQDPYLRTTTNRSPGWWQFMPDGDGTPAYVRFERHGATVFTISEGRDCWVATDFGIENHLPRLEDRGTLTKSKKLELLGETFDVNMTKGGIVITRNDQLILDASPRLETECTLVHWQSSGDLVQFTGAFSDHPPDGEDDIYCMNVGYKMDEHPSGQWRKTGETFVRVRPPLVKEANGEFVGIWPTGEGELHWRGQDTRKETETKDPRLVQYCSTVDTQGYDVKWSYRLRNTTHHANWEFRVKDKVLAKAKSVEKIKTEICVDPYDGE